MHLKHPFATQVGIMRCLEFAPGFYAYTGSAFGPGGLRARIGRHLSSTPVIHWHIDYLQQKTAVVEVWFTYEGVHGLTPEQASEFPR
jgi:Uri superfamily endonuclease